MIRRRRVLCALCALAASGVACGRRHGTDPAPGRVRVIFRHQPMWGDPAPFHEILESFARSRPDVELIAEALPNDADVAHQFFVTAIEGGARDFDVFAIDVTWVAEFARAGWIADLSARFPPEQVRRDFLPGVASAVIHDERTFALPWYLDVGVLYRRTDLAPAAPRTFAELVAAGGAAPSGVHGLVYQGRQYEGLVCNAYEAIWGHGADEGSPDRLLLGSEGAQAGLEYLRALLERGISPASVTAMGEEDSRRVFQAGSAVFLRNWPYAWSELEREGSPVRGKVALSPLPTSSGEPGSGTLGGFQLAINANAPPERREAALDLVAHLTSKIQNLGFARHYGRIPPRRAVYDDPRLALVAPQIAALRPMIVRARPRPVTPYYPMISDTLAAEFSAAVTGVRSVKDSLDRARRLVGHLTRGAF